jgi:DNA-3-methyladenine glycosylase II
MVRFEAGYQKREAVRSQHHEPHKKAVSVAGPEIPLDFAATLGRYRRYGPDGVNCFDGRTFRKVIRTPEGLRLMVLSCDEDGYILLSVHPEGTPGVYKSASTVAGKLLGLTFNLEAFYAFAATDPVLHRAATALPGLRPTLTADPFEMLVALITAQQINLSFAFTTRCRLVKAYGEAMRRDDEVYYAFPTVATLAGADPDALRAMAFSRQKTAYMIGLAQAVNDGIIDLTGLSDQTDQTVIDHLIALTGIGRWTADWFLARHLGRGRAAAVGDLAVRKALQHFYFEEEKQDEATLRTFTERWGDHANLAVHYLLSLHALEGRPR